MVTSIGNEMHDIADSSMVVCCTVLSGFKLTKKRAMNSKNNPGRC